MGLRCADCDTSLDPGLYVEFKYSPMCFECVGKRDAAYPESAPRDEPHQTIIGAMIARMLRGGLGSD